MRLELALVTILSDSTTPGTLWQSNSNSTAYDDIGAINKSYDESPKAKALNLQSQGHSIKDYHVGSIAQWLGCWSLAGRLPDLCLIYG